MRLIDARGLEVEISQAPGRVVSLVPSVTETLFDLGAGPAVVGVTSFCLFPEEPLASCTRVGGTKNPDVALIRELRPDLVYVNLEENLRVHAEELAEFTTVYASEPKRVEDVPDLVRILGAVHERSDEAESLAREIEAEAEALAGSDRFTFACPIWKRPWMWCGGDTYVSSLLSTAGGVNVFEDRERYPIVEPAGVLSLRPGILILPDEPYVFRDADREELERFGFESVSGPLPGHLFTWHGSRTLLGLRFLRQQRFGRFAGKA